jgi:hypothetical protein
MRWGGRGGYWVSDDRSEVDVGAGPPLAEFRERLGVWRRVSDDATFAGLCDLFVDVAARGSGLGRSSWVRPWTTPT